MSLKFVSVPHGDLGQGVDALSSEDSIPEGCSELLVNAEPSPEGYLRKREGYQGVWGFLPVRVRRIDYSAALTNNIRLFLDQSIDLSGIESQLHSRPISVFGRTSSVNTPVNLGSWNAATNTPALADGIGTAGTFYQTPVAGTQNLGSGSQTWASGEWVRYTGATWLRRATNPQGDFPVGIDFAKWYPGFNADARLSLLAGSNTTQLTQSLTQLTSPYVWVGLAESTSPSSLDNSQFLVNNVNIDLASNEVDIFSTLPTALSAFVYFLPVAAVPGVNYLSPPSGSTSVPSNPAPYTTTILASTHGLNTPNIQVQAWDLQGGILRTIDLDAVTLNAADDVTVTLTNHSGSTINLILSLSAAPVANAVQGLTGGIGVITATFTPDTPFTFVTAYTEDLAGVTRTQVLPQSVTYSAATGLTTVTFDVSDSTTAGQFFIYWQSVTVTTNQLTLTGVPVLAAFSDLSPQLTLWGLDHSLIYSSTQAGRGGWVTELDTYRAEAEQFLVAGLGGNLYQGQEASDAVAAQYGIPTLYPRLSGRLASNAQLGPAFQLTGDSTARSRGWVRSDSATEAGFLEASSMVWDSGVGAMRVTLPLVNGAVSGTPINTQDQVTIQGAGYTRFNGTWPITQVTVTTSLVTLWFSVPGVSSGLWDDLYSAAAVGVFTDSFSTATDSGWLPGDLLLTDALPEGLPVTCISATGVASVWQGFTRPALLPAGLIVVGQRTAQVLPLRTLAGIASVTGMVTGDNLQLDSYVRQMRLYGVNARATGGVTLVADGSTATATVTTGDTTSFAIGDRLLLTQAGLFTGEVVVTGIPSTTTFTFDTTLQGSQSGTLQGMTVTLDESLQWQDSIDSSVIAQVPGRWLPLEAPDTSWNETPGPYISYFDSPYDDQPILRSAQVTDSLILNNGVDRPLKLDGSNVYRPGLTRWQPQLFLASAPAATGTITLDPLTVSYSAAATGSGTFYITETGTTAGTENTFPVGTRIKGPGGLITYTVTGVGVTSEATPRGYITVNLPIDATDSGAHTLTQVTSFSYYFRLNAVDANRNVVASAATGSVDWTYAATTSTALRIRLVGLPAFMNTPMDYDRLEVQVYRTKANGVAPFYLLTTLPMSFNAHDGYLDWVDTFSDESLQDLDPVNTALKGAELGTAWSAPLRSKRVTSLGNRLVLANITSDPYLDFRFVDSGAIIASHGGTANLTGLRFLLKRDATDVGTTTDMVNRVGYQLLTGGQIAITGLTGSSGQSFTVTTASPQNLAPGNWVYLFRGNPTSSTNLQTHLMGWWQVHSATASTFTILWPKAPGAFTVIDEVDAVIVATDPKDVPIWIREDYNYQYGVEARYALGQNTSPGTTPAQDATTRRWSNAVNTTQRMVDRSLSSMRTFTPWVLADAGGEFSTGQIVFRQPLASSAVFSLTLPSFTGFNIYVNDVQQFAGTVPTAIEQVRSSRVLVSYQNFSEVFDNPLSPVDSQSDSAIDVNPSDGQEITAVIPFFGDSTFGAAMKDSVLLVFKTQSIYLVNLAAKAAGQNPIQRLESMGLGCTAPNSVAPTRMGIMFANESGVYRIDQSMTVYYMGRRLQRLWREQTNLGELDLMFGHNHSSKSQYHLSVPSLATLVPDTTYTYNNTREYSMQGITNTIQLYSTREGSWTQYVPSGQLGSIGWASLQADSYFASRLGRVLVRRNTGLPQDFRDDDQAISMDAWLRGMDFGDPGVRKDVPWAVVAYRTPAGLPARTGTAVLSSTDLSDEWTPADLTTLAARPLNGATDDLGDTQGNRAAPIRYSFTNKRGVRFQLRFTNSTKDEPVEITQIRYIVAGLTPPLGVRAAASGPNPAAIPPTGRG